MIVTILESIIVLLAGASLPLCMSFSVDTPGDNVAPSSPCIRICRYNNNFMDGQVCIGCFRDSYEISNWYKLDEMERKMALEDANDRRVDWEGFLARGGDNDDETEFLEDFD